jgi:hypothetical protein
MFINIGRSDCRFSPAQSRLYPFSWVDSSFKMNFEEQEMRVCTALPRLRTESSRTLLRTWEWTFDSHTRCRNCRSSQRLLDSKELYSVELVVSQPSVRLCPNCVGVVDCLFFDARNWMITSSAQQPEEQRTTRVTKRYALCVGSGHLLLRGFCESPDNSSVTIWKPKHWFYVLLTAHLDIWV